MAHEPTRPDRPSSGRHGNGNGNGNGGGGNFNATYGSVAGGGPSTNDQIRDVLHVVFKRKRLIAALFLAVALPGVLTAILKRPVYVASAKVMVSTQRTDPTIQPTDLTRLDTIQLNESLVNSEVHIITSREVIEQVVRALASTSNGDGLPHTDSKSGTFGAQVLKMGRNLGVTPIKNSNVIQIDYRSGDAMAAARVVNRVVDEYLAYHAHVHGTKGLPRFYDEQRRDLERQLRRAEADLLEFADTEGIVAPAEEIASGIRTANELQSVLREVNANISGTEERIRAIRDQIALQPEIIKRSQYLEINPVISQLSTQLVDRQVDRISLLRKYTEKDRHVRDNAEEIADLQSQIEMESRERPTVVAHQLFRTNPIRDAQLRDLLEREGQLREMRARQVTLEEEFSRVNRRLTTLRRVSVLYDRLDREVKNWRAAYELYVRREQEARISKAMDEQKLVNIDIVQRPALPLPRADTQRVTVLLSLVAGLVVGIAGAFGREYLSRSLRSEYDVGRHLGLPLLASIGETPRA
jgi:succinoglycan biosynthesis transport protein ExoP